MSMKNSLTPAGIKPATLRIVAQHFNHCATTAPCQSSWLSKQRSTAQSSDSAGALPVKQDFICVHAVVLSTYIINRGKPSFIAEENDPKCQLH